MKKLAAMVLVMLAAQGVARAQKGSNAIGLVAESGLSFPGADFGFGGYVKGYYGIGKHGQLTLMAGISRFASDAAVGRSKTITRTIPVLVGYKRHIRSFYIEPQAGIGELGGKVDYGGDYSRPSVTTFYASMGAGIDVKRFELGVRYQYAKGIDPPDAGIWSDRKSEFAGIHVGYKIF